METLPKEIIKHILDYLNIQDYYSCIVSSNIMNVLNEKEKKHKKYSILDLDRVMLSNDLEGVKYKVEVLKEKIYLHHNPKIFTELVEKRCLDVISYFLEICECKTNYSFLFLEIFSRSNYFNYSLEKILKFINLLFSCEPFDGLFINLSTILRQKIYQQSLQNHRKIVSDFLKLKLEKNDNGNYN